jgi:hypothetical protein
MKNQKKTGAAKVAPKGDTTQKRRQSKRMAQLNEKAQAKGWSGISEYLTAVLKDEITIPQNNA